MNPPKLDISLLSEITENFCGIYICLCLMTGKYYLGSAKNFYKRRIDHKKLLKKDKHHSRHFQSAWKKHSSENFVWYKIRDCRETNLKIIEQHYLDVFRPWDDSIGMNISRSADCGNRGQPLSDETKKKISQAHTGKILSAETRESISKGKKGLPFTENQKAARKKFLLRLSENEIPHFNIGHIPSVETREKISKANSGENNCNFGIKRDPLLIKKTIESRCKDQNFYFVRITDNGIFHSKNIREFCRLNKLNENSVKTALYDIWNDKPTTSGKPRFIEFRKASDIEIAKYTGNNPKYFPELSECEKNSILEIRKLSRKNDRNSMFGKKHSEESKLQMGNKRIKKCILLSPLGNSIEVFSVQDRKETGLSHNQIKGLMSGKIKKTQSGWKLISVIK